MSIWLPAGCGQSSQPQRAASTPDDSSTVPASQAAASNKTIDTLRIAFVPSRELDEIITAMESLKQMLTDELSKLGYDVSKRLLICFPLERVNTPGENSLS